VFGKRREPEDEPEDDAPAEADAGPFRYQEPPGKSLVIRCDNYTAAYKLWLSIFGPGSDLAQEAERQRAQWRKPDRRA
jgi:hypothetical protein